MVTEFFFTLTVLLGSSISYSSMTAAARAAVLLLRPLLASSSSSTAATTANFCFKGAERNNLLLRPPALAGWLVLVPAARSQQAAGRSRPHAAWAVHVRRAVS